MAVAVAEREQVSVLLNEAPIRLEVSEVAPILAVLEAMAQEPASSTVQTAERPYRYYSSGAMVNSQAIDDFIESHYGKRIKKNISTI